MPRLQRSDRHVIAALFLLVSSVYFATFVGITSSNDGSHYALVRALVDTGGFEISAYLGFTEHQDYALNGALRFSDRPPGAAFWAAPFYAAARLLPEPVVAPPSKHDRGQPLLMGVAAASAIAGAATIALFYLLLRQHFELTAAVSTLAALALAFGTILWKYGSALFSHSVSAMLVLLTVYLVARVVRNPGTCYPAWTGLGLAAGATVFVEYTNVVFAALVGLLLTAYVLRTVDRARRVRSLAALAAGMAAPVALLMAYNTVNFGGPFELSTFNVDTSIWPQNENFGTDFATPLSEGLRGLLVWGGDNQGLLLMSPLSAFALPGFVLLWRRSRREFALVAGILVAMLLLFSKSTTYNSLTNDGRYLTPFLGLWFVPLAVWLDRVFARVTNEFARVGWALLVYGLLFLSVRNVFWHIALAWNHDLDPTGLQPFSVSAANLNYALGAVFPNVLNVWWLWWLLSGVGVILWILRNIGRPTGSPWSRVGG